MLLCYFNDLLLFLNHCIPVSDHSNNKLQTVLFWTGALLIKKLQLLFQHIKQISWENGDKNWIWLEDSQYCDNGKLN